MTKTDRTRTHQRTMTRKLIDDMLKQRQQMLVLLWEMTKSDLHHVDENIKEMLDDFSTILVDYIAAGHFGLYQRLIEGNERRGPVLEKAQQILPRITQTTDLAVSFSERFENADEKILNARLATELSSLAEEVTVRIELEDQLIAAMMGAEPATNVATN
jgi:regulator of sigma D